MISGRLEHMSAYVYTHGAHVFVAVFMCVCTLNPSHLIRALPGPGLWPAKDKDGSLGPGTAVGRTHREIPEAVLVDVAEAGEGEAEASLRLFSVPDVPLPELVLQRQNMFEMYVIPQSLKKVLTELDPHIMKTELVSSQCNEVF